MLTAQQRLELGLPASLAWAIARSIYRQSHLTDKGRARCDASLELLRQAANEPLADLHGADRDKLARRLQRATCDLTGVFVDEPVVNLLWALHEALRILAETGGLQVVDGGSFDRGWGDLTSWCFEDDATTEGQGTENAKLLDSREAVGRRMGHRLLAEFQKRGLYRRALGSLRFAA
jgi:hypothetical protein